MAEDGLVRPLVNVGVADSSGAEVFKSDLMTRPLGSATGLMV